MPRSHDAQAISPLTGLIDAVDRLTFTQTSLLALESFQDVPESLLLVVVVVIVTEVTCVAPCVRAASLSYRLMVKVIQPQVLLVRCVRHAAAVTHFTHGGTMMQTGYVIIVE